jgi:hypothetical protein
MHKRLTSCCPDEDGFSFVFVTAASSLGGMTDTSVIISICTQKYEWMIRKIKQITFCLINYKNAIFINASRAQLFVLEEETADRWIINRRKTIYLVVIRGFNAQDINIGILLYRRTCF